VLLLLSLLCKRSPLFVHTVYRYACMPLYAHRVAICYHVMLYATRCQTVSQHTQTHMKCVCADVATLSCVHALLLVGDRITKFDIRPANTSALLSSVATVVPVVPAFQSVATYVRRIGRSHESSQDHDLSNVDKHYVRNLIQRQPALNCKLCD
jgi:hypothetical protein